MEQYRVVGICAGAGGQSLGLEVAGFEHELAVELDPNAANTLRHNRPYWKVAEGDVASPAVWNPAQYEGIDLLAGGVPCPPFTIAGKQLGATDERDLFAWAIELCATMQPRALMLENVRGLSLPRFSAYRQHVLDRLAQDQGWNTEVATGRLLGQWEQLVGPAVAEHCRPVEVIGTELVVAAESTAWATQLRLMGPVLLDRLSAQVGPGVVRTVRVLGPSGPRWTHGPRVVRGRGPRDTYG